jgi:hypothetical protein
MYAAPPSYLQPSYGVPILGADATQSDLYAIAYQIEKAKTTGPVSGQQAFLEAQGAYWEGKKLTQNIFLRGPEDDKMAYLTVAWCAAMAARTVGSSKNGGLVAIAETYLRKGRLEKPFNLFYDYRKDILLGGMREMEGALRAAGIPPQGTYGVAILANSAKEANLDWSGDQLTYLDLMGEAAQEMLEDAGEMVDPDNWKKFWEENKWWLIPAGGLLLGSVVLIAGRPYLVAGKELVGGLFGEDEDEG